METLSECFKRNKQMMTTFKQLALAAAMAAASAFFSAAADAPEVHNFANYNVRYVNPNNGDTGEKSWTVRGPYVAQIVKDYAFDIVGMQEVTGLNGGKSVNSATGRSQLADLKAWLPDYSFLEWERSGNNNVKDYSYNVIAYRKERYECLGSGCFWLSPSPDTPGPGWETNPDYSGLWRTCGWAKMKVRSTGEIFYFAVTHVNYGPTLDGRNSGELISRRLGEIAGNHPVVLVGDFNMRRADHPEAYRGYAASFYDAALTAGENYCLPTSNPSTTVTGQNWLPVTSSQMSGSEFDFCFYRNMDVLSRHIITENYGRTVNPSDHFPLLMRCTLSGQQAPATVYVDREAAAGGDGTAERPFRSIAEGMAAAGILGTVKVTAGTYDEALKLPASMTIAGGYDADFRTADGRTVIDAASFDEIPVWVEAWHSLNLSGFEIKNYSSTKMATDGALRFAGLNLSLDNVDFSGNSAFSTGGALNFAGGALSLSSCRFDSNAAAESGGAVSAKLTGNLTVTDCTFAGNSAKSGSALVLTDADEILLRNSAFTANESKNGGTLYLNGCPSATKCAIVNSTFASNLLAAPGGLAVVTRKFGGSAICTDLSTDLRVNAAHLTVVGNSCTFAGSNKANFNGSAINFFGLGRLCILNSIVAGNSSDAACADLWTGESAVVEKSRFNIWSCARAVSHTPDASDFTGADAASALTALTGLLDATVADGCLKPTVRCWGGGATPVVRPLSTEFGGRAVNVLTSYQRMLENQFTQDIDGNGSIGGVLAIDQCGNPRADSSMPGAAEYIEYSGVGSALCTESEFPRLSKLSAGCYLLSGFDGAAVLSDIDGRRLGAFAAGDDGCAEIDLGTRPAGVYLLTADGKSFKLVK